MKKSFDEVLSDIENKQRRLEALNQEAQKLAHELNADLDLHFGITYSDKIDLIKTIKMVRRVQRMQ
jgi:hypothetical protein